MAIDFLTRTLFRNHLDDRAQAVLHAWGEPLPQGPWEVILGGDILYRPECFAALFDTIAGSLTADGCALLSDPRITLEHGLPSLAKARGLRWESARIDHFSLVTLTRRDSSRAGGCST